MQNIKTQETSEATFWEHLEELRKIIIRLLIAITVLMPATYFCAPHLMDIMVAHCSPDRLSLQYFTVMEPFLVQLKVAFILSVISLFPYIVYQIWSFIVPALSPKESRKYGNLTVSSMVMFFIGVAFAYYFVLPMIIRFSMSFQRDSLQPMLGVENYISIGFTVMLAFGMVFQLPNIISFLVSSGIVEKESLKKQRPYIIVGIATLSAFLTPPDYFSQLIMAIPTYLLFEAALLLSKRDSMKDASVSPKGFDSQ